MANVCNSEENTKTFQIKVLQYLSFVSVYLCVCVYVCVFIFACAFLCFAALFLVHKRRPLSARPPYNANKINLFFFYARQLQLKKEV